MLRLPPLTGVQASRDERSQSGSAPDGSPGCAEHSSRSSSRPCFGRFDGRRHPPPRSTASAGPKDGSGFAVSTLAPNKQGPLSAGDASGPTVSANASGTADVSWMADHDLDDQILSYELFQGGVVVARQDDVSQFWNRPVLSRRPTPVSPRDADTRTRSERRIPPGTASSEHRRSSRSRRNRSPPAAFR